MTTQRKELRMTTQAQDLGKTLGASMIAAADKHGTAIVAASIHIHTGLSQIAEALEYRNPAGRRQDAPGTPRMPGRVSVAAEPLRDAQDANMAWTHYRKTCAPNPDHMAAAHKAFHAGWDMATTKLQWDNAPEPEWLHADALDRLPYDAIVLPRDRKSPRGKAEDGRWWIAGQDYGFNSDDIAPARVLWTPEANR